jgi:hypothetical protein
LTNPFEALGKPRADNVTYDEWGGMFECQHFRCRSIVDVAKYLKKEKILTWVCGDGHTNKIENVDE